MRRSSERILTTHVGSLPRPPALIALMQRIETGQSVDEAAASHEIKHAVRDVVRAQVAHGIDVVDDGEMGKPGFVNYVNDRLAGFEPARAGARPQWSGSREIESFPEFYAWFEKQMSGSGTTSRQRMVCTGPISYKHNGALARDIANLKEATATSGVEDVFMPSISPATVEAFQTNEYYRTDEEFLFAIAEAIREEYLAIVEAGFVLQIDDPRLVTHYVRNPQMSVAQCRAWAAVRVEALNHALRGIPADRIRHHVCYGINMGPRIHDMEMKDIVDIMLTIRAGAYSFEAANPRHEHEWRIWETVKLPEGKIIIPGVITQSSFLVEHPELVAERIVRFAGVVGRENVIAGSDCGFATFATADETHPSIAWAKLKALSEGARLASRTLWPERSSAGRGTSGSREQKALTTT